MKIAKSLQDFVHYDIVALDFETTNLIDKSVVLFSLAAVTEDAPTMKNIVAGVFKADQMDKLTEFVRGRRIVFHNCKFDCSVLMKYGVSPLEFHPDDTSIMAMLLNENESVSLKSRAEKDLGLHMKEWNEGMVDKFNAGDEEEYIEYSSLDAVATILLFHKYRKQLKEQSLVTAYTIEMKAAIPIMFMEMNGIAFSEKRCRELEKNAEDAKIMYEDMIFEQAGYVFGLSKPRELAGFLYDDLGIQYKPEYSKNLKGGGRSAGKEVLQDILEELPEDDFRHEIVENIIEWKRVSKLLSSFFKSQLEASRLYGDGRVHANFNQLSIVTGRIASTDPNLMQLPAQPILKSVPESKIRSMYVASRGMKFIDADYNQIELRMMAHMSGDVNMVQAFKQNMDFHQFIADMCGISRKDAKTANFGKQYGMSPFSFSKKTKMPLEEAKAFYKNYAKKFPATEQLRQDVLKAVLKYGYVRLIGGRKRRAEFDKYEDAAAIQRAFLSSLIQGSAATVLKLALIKCFDRYKNKDVKIVLTVHDEILHEAPAEMAEQVAREVKEDMESAITLRVPLVADPKIGNTFGDFK